MADARHPLPDLVLEPLEAVVQCIQVAGYDAQQRLLLRAAAAQRDLVASHGRLHQHLGPAVLEQRPAGPAQVRLLHETVHPHDEPAHQAPGQKLVAVRQHQVPGPGPIAQFRGLRRRQVLRNQPGLLPRVRQPITQLEPDHQGAQLHVLVRVAPVGPQAVTVGQREPAPLRLHPFVIQDAEHRVRHPLILQEHRSPQLRRLLKVQEHAQVVQILAQPQRLVAVPFPIQAQVTSVDREVLMQRDVRLGPRQVLQVLANGDPLGRHVLTDVRQPLGEVFHRLAQTVRRTWMFQVAPEDLLHVGKPSLDSRLVDLFAPPALLVLKDQQRAAFAEGFDHLQPELEALVMDRAVVAPRVVDQHVQRTLRQKELMGGVIDLLAAEVPGVEPEGASVGDRELMGMDIDPAGGLVFGGQVHLGQEQAAQQAGLSGPTLADDQQFGFKQPIHTLGFDFAEVAQHGLRPLRNNLWRRMGQRAVLYIDARSFPPSVGPLDRQPGQNE